MSNAPLIHIENLSKRYKLYASPRGRVAEWLSGGRVSRHRDFWALKDFSLNVSHGECVGVIGPNGAGKSTLLKVLSGTLAASGGSFNITGRVLSLLELGTGFNAELSGRQNIMETAALLGFKREDTIDRIKEIEAFAELGDFFDRPIKIYSSGMGVRLAFSMFVFMKPDVLIVDEALAVGDIGFQRKCYKKLEELMAGGMTCLFVTHDLGAVVRFCHRAVVLFQGQKIFEGDPRQACNVLNKIYFGEAGVDDKLDYGDGAAMIDQIWFEDETGERLASVPARSPLVFSYSCRFNTAVTDPVFGFHIKTVYGMEVCTASSDYMGYEFGSFEPGDRLTLKWTLDLNLNPGTYFFGCGCRYANESRFMSRRVDAMKFPIVDNPTFGGIVNVFRDLKIEKTLANAESEPQMNADGLR